MVCTIIFFWQANYWTIFNSYGAWSLNFNILLFFFFNYGYFFINQSTSYNFLYYVNWVGQKCRKVFSLEALQIFTTPLMEHNAPGELHGPRVRLSRLPIGYDTPFLACDWLQPLLPWWAPSTGPRVRLSDWLAPSYARATCPVSSTGPGIHFRPRRPTPSDSIKIKIYYFWAFHPFEANTVRSFASNKEKPAGRADAII